MNSFAPHNVFHQYHFYFSWHPNCCYTIHNPITNTFSWIGMPFKYLSAISHGRVAQSDVRSKSNVSRSISDRWQIDTRSIPNRDQIDARSLPDRYQIVTRSIPDRYQIETRSIPDRYQIDTRSIPDRYQIDTWSIPDRYQIDTRSIPDREFLHMKTNLL